MVSLTHFLCAKMAPHVVHNSPLYHEKLSSALLGLHEMAELFDDLCLAQIPVSHGFNLLCECQIYFNPRRLPPIFQNFVKEEISRMLNGTITMPAMSAWAFSIKVVTWKIVKPQLCIGNQCLNRSMRPDRFPLFNMEENFEGMNGYSYFARLELFFSILASYICPTSHRHDNVRGQILVPFSYRSCHLG